MKLIDAIVYIRQKCPVGTTLPAYIAKQAAAGDPTCRRLIAAETAFNAPLEPDNE